MSSLSSGISGLQANQELLDVVGNNLANANTTGFKAQSVNFSDLLYQTLSPATSSNFNTGGTDPVQVGLGVQVGSVETNLAQGGLTSTGGNLDMAIQGAGYFVESDGGTNSFTRAGSFAVNDQNYLIDPATGNLVQRFGTVGEPNGTSPGFQVPGNEGIQIPYGAGLPGQATTSITLSGNLNASAAAPLAQTLTSTQPFTANNAPATLATPLNSLSDNTTPYVSTDSIQLQGTTSAGTPVNATVPLASYFPPGPTMGDLINAINANFPGSTASLDSSGNLVVQSNSTGPSQLSLTISDPSGQTGSTNWSNHALTVTTTGQVGATVSTAIQVYDSQGTAHNLSLVFQKQGSNTWSLTGSIPAADGTVVSGQVSGITFNSDGSFNQAGGGQAGPSMTFQFTGLSAPQTISFSFGTPNGFNGITQFGGSSSASATNQNGSASGTLTSVSIAQDGTINGVFTNGQTLPLAQLAIATFANPEGLSRSGQNLFNVTSQSGQPLIGTATTGGRGSIQQGSLEGSNVDVAAEFTQLIIAQNGYDVNSRTITVSDQVLQTLAQIIPQT